jgi:gliding motility-associated-like protein
MRYFYGMRSILKAIFLFLFFTCLSVSGWSQACPGLGQNPTSAFPVCGVNVFTQSSVPACNGTRMPTPCGNDGAPYADINPYWYKFTCYGSGTLGFIITPNNLDDDYDWQLFDITGHDPNDVYSDPSLIVSANWSGSSGITGASSAARNSFECASLPEQGIPTFSTMPNLITGHNYLLMVSHFTSTNQSGYTLQFPTGQQGGTASIVNPVVPNVENSYAVCDGTEMMIILNKKVNCSSIAADGSDFFVSGGPVPISVVSATGNNCSNGFDSDSILLKLNRVLSPGSYAINAQVGTDGNTVTDNCANALMPGIVANIKFTPAQPTPMDSIVPVTCIKDAVQLIFSTPMKCSSIAADGSDFLITGPVPVAIKSASGVCSNGVSTVINILLTAPIRINGTFTLHLQNGTDGNTLLNECGEITPAGSSLSFTTQNITTADFQATIAGGCRFDTVYFTHNGYGGTTDWEWRIDGAVNSTSQNYSLVSKAFGPHSVQLKVSNGFCTDTLSTTFTVPDYTVKANFSVADTLCPTDTLHFSDLSTANTIAWRWSFGNGSTSTLQFPPAQNYPLTGRSNYYTARLVAQNSFGCMDTAYHLITVLASCYIAVPSAFTPNGDGLNDYLYPLNAFAADQLEFRVYNRYGQVVFESRDWTKKWDGRIKGQMQGSGTFVWTLNYVDRNTGKKISLKGTTVLIR